MVTQNVSQGKTSPGNQTAFPAFEGPRAPGLDLYDLLPFREIYFASVSCLWTQPGAIVNLDRHNLKTPPCSKYPPAFGIDLLIDDSPGVEQEGRTHGFPVIIVSPDNPDWAEKLLDEIDHLTPQNVRIDEKMILLKQFFLS